MTDVPEWKKVNGYRCMKGEGYKEVEFSARKALRNQAESLQVARREVMRAEQSRCRMWRKRLIRNSGIGIGIRTESNLKKENGNWIKIETYNEKL